MSEPIGETFVRITPIVDEQSFKAQAEPQIKAAVQGVKAEVALDLQNLQQQLRAVTGGIQSATASGRPLEGPTLAASKAQADAFAATLGRLVTAQAEAGAGATFLDDEIRRMAPDFQALTVASAEYAQILTRVEAQQVATGRTGGTLREQLRAVGEGRAGLGSILSGGSLLRLGATGLAIGAVFQTLTRLQDALKVTGDEAATFEGKFRNATSSLLTGDVIGAFGAFGAQVERVSDDLKEAGKSLDEVKRQSKLVTLQDAVEQSKKFRDYVTEASTVYTRFGEGGTRTKPAVDLEASAAAALKLTNELREQAVFADRVAPLLEKFPKPIKESNEAAQKLGSAFREGGAEAAVLLSVLTQIDRLDLFKATAHPTFGITSLNTGPVGPRDTTNTEATRRATAEARAAASAQLQDDLAQANRELQDELNSQKALIGQAEGRAKRAQDVATARAKVAGIERQIAAQNEAAAKEAESDRLKALAAKAKDLRDALDFREQALQLDLQAAQATENTIADDKRALLALIRFNHAKSENMQLEKDERLAALGREKQLRQDLAALNKEALADALGVKQQNLQNAIQAAKLTDDSGVDDNKANAAFLKFLKQQVANAKKLKDGGKALADARADLIAFQLQLKGAAGSGGFSLQELFAEAAGQFTAFGSNIAGRNGVLSGQDERAAFAADVLGGSGDPSLGIQGEQLTEQQRQTVILTRIWENTQPGFPGIGGAKPRAGKAAPHENLQATVAAAKYGLGF